MANKPISNFKMPTNKPKPSAASINTAIRKLQIGTVTAIKNIALINSIMFTPKYPYSQKAWGHNLNISSTT